MLNRRRFLQRSSLALSTAALPGRAGRGPSTRPCTNSNLRGPMPATSLHGIELT